MPRLSLTSKLVDNAPLPRDRKSVEYFDQRMPGLVLRVSARGTKSWNAVYRHHGRARRLTIGRYPIITLDDARARAREVRRSFSRYRRADAAGMITGAQIRAARKLLGWPRDRLCPRAGLSVTMLRKIEDGLRTPTNEQRLGIQGALEAAGVEFTNGDEPGVKLKATKMN